LIFPFPLVPKHVWVCARESSGVFVFLQNSIAFLKGTRWNRIDSEFRSQSN
jgi:hypothetical protein